MNRADTLRGTEPSSGCLVVSRVVDAVMIPGVPDLNVPYRAKPCSIVGMLSHHINHAAEAVGTLACQDRGKVHGEPSDRTGKLSGNFEQADR